MRSKKKPNPVEELNLPCEDIFCINIATKFIDCKPYCKYHPVKKKRFEK